MFARLLLCWLATLARERHIIPDSSGYWTGFESVKYKDSKRKPSNSIEKYVYELLKTHNYCVNDIENMIFLPGTESIFMFTFLLLCLFIYAIIGSIIWIWKVIMYVKVMV
jgi:hypothetical protein